MKSTLLSLAIVVSGALSFLGVSLGAFEVEASTLPYIKMPCGAALYLFHPG